MNEEKETRNLNEEHPEEAGSEPRAGGEVREPEEVKVQAGIEQTEDSDGSRSLQNLQTVRNWQNRN
ncbi:hypothetical protein [Faecalibaculum rodentium]|uniref:hypothetical protein n=1 Tax=Faecalibaculum rodentium TaxID=1702221 RepID=UPI0023F1C9EE|nr:hypothetical protein [Faecalibaculum rodentium]